MKHSLIIGQDSTTNEIVCLSPKDRDQHAYVIGLTKTGKTTLLLNLALQDIENDEAVCVIDPHGDLINDLLARIPPERAGDVIVWEPSDTERPFGLNLYECSDVANTNLADRVASEVMGTFYKLFHDSWGPQMEDLLRATALTIIYNQDLPEPLRPTMAEIPTIFTNEYYRSFLVARVANPIVRHFWESSYNPLTPYQQWDLHRSSMNKVRRFLLNPTIRNIVGQGTSSLNLRQAMDERKILLFNLSKGMLGEDNGALLGSVLVGKILISLLSRADQERSTREPFHLFVDEFHNYATNSFETLQTEARKFGADIFVFHQFRDQIEERQLKMSALSVGTVIVFRVNSHDAAELAWVFDTSPPPGEPKLEMVTEAAYETYTEIVWDPQEAEVEYYQTLGTEQARLLVRDRLLRECFNSGYISPNTLRAWLDGRVEYHEWEKLHSINLSCSPSVYAPAVDKYIHEHFSVSETEARSHPLARLEKNPMSWGNIISKNKALSHPLPPSLPSEAERQLACFVAEDVRKPFMADCYDKHLHNPDYFTSQTKLFYEFLYRDCDRNRLPKPSAAEVGGIAGDLFTEVRALLLPIKKQQGRYVYTRWPSSFGQETVEPLPFPEVLSWLYKQFTALEEQIRAVEDKRWEVWKRCRKEEERERYLGYELPVKSVKPDPFRKDYGEEYTQYAWKEGPTKSSAEVAALIANDLSDLPQYMARCKLGTRTANSDGRSNEYTITTFPPPEEPTDGWRRAEQIRQQSQQTYGRDRAIVEQEISERVSRSLAWAKPGTQPITKRPAEPRSHFRQQPPAARPPESAADDDQPIQSRRKTS